MRGRVTCWKKDYVVLCSPRGTFDAHCGCCGGGCVTGDMQVACSQPAPPLPGLVYARGVSGERYGKVLSDLPRRSLQKQRNWPRPHISSLLVVPFWSVSLAEFARHRPLLDLAPHICS